MNITKYSWHLPVNEANENAGRKSMYKAECIAQRTLTEGPAINTLLISSKNMFNENMDAEFCEIWSRMFLELTWGSSFKNYMILGLTICKYNNAIKCF